MYIIGRYLYGTCLMRAFRPRLMTSGTFPLGMAVSLDLARATSKRVLRKPFNSNLPRPTGPRPHCESGSSQMASDLIGRF